MKKLHLALWIAVLLIASSLASAEDWNKTYTVSGKPAIRTQSDDGHIQVRACQCKQVEAHVISMGYKPGEIRITENQSGDRVSLEVLTPNHHIHWGFNEHRTLRIELVVPQESDLDLHTSDGHVSIEKVKGDIRLDTSDGHIDVSDADGKLDARSSDGHITVSGRFDQLNLKTSDGHISAEVRPGSKIGPGWSLRSSDGRIALRLPPDFAAEVDAHTGDGQIVSDIPLTVENYTGSKSSLRGKLNGGGALLSLRTSDGGIHIERI